MKKTMNKKGFTLAELLIVVAIIAVLVAISIPVFTTQLEKARESTDAANLRSAYAEVMVQAVSEPNADYSQTVAAKQTQTGWTNTSITDIGGIAVGGDSGIQAKVNGATWTIKWTASTGAITIQ